MNNNAEEGRQIVLLIYWLGLALFLLNMLVEEIRKRGGGGDNKGDTG